MRILKVIIIVGMELTLSLGCTNRTKEPEGTPQTLSDNLENESPKPINTENEIETTLDEIISKGKQDAAFVIFKLKGTEYYVQYALVKNGLELFVPNVNVFLTDHLEKVQELLISLKFEKLDPGHKTSGDFIQNLKEGQFTIYDDGIYAQVGRDVKFVKQFTISMLKKVLGASDGFEVKTQLELNG